MAHTTPISYSCYTLLIGTILFFTSFQASAQEGLSPEETIQEISQSLKAVLSENQRRIQADSSYLYQLADEVIAPSVDFNRLSGLALGKHWRGATAAQKHEFMAQFQALLVRTYTTAFREFGELSIRFLPRHDDSTTKKVMVRSEVERPGAPAVSVNYRMVRQKDGSWQTYDVIIEGISLVTNYRTTFSKEVRRNGMQGLINRITKLNNQRIAAAQQASR